LSEKQELKGMLDEAEKRGSSLAVEVSRLIIFYIIFCFLSILYCFHISKKIIVLLISQ